MRIRWIFACLSITILLLLISCKESDQVVARIGSVTITEAQFRQRLIDQFRTEDLSTLTFEQKRDALEKLLDDWRKALKARELGLDQDPEFLRFRTRKLNLLLANTLYNQIVVDSLIPDTLLEEYQQYAQFRIKAVVVKVGHRGAEIFDRDRSKEEAENLAKHYRDLLVNSRDPEEYAKQVTDDSRVRPVLDPYRLGRFPMHVDRAVFSAEVGDVVGPLYTTRGYVIFKILDKQYDPDWAQRAYAEEKLRNILRTNYLRGREKKRFETLTEKFKEKYGALVREENIQEAFELLQDWGKNPGRKLEDFTEGHRSLVLGETNFAQYTFGDLIRFYDQRLLREYRKFSSPEVLRTFVDRELNLLVWAKEAEHRGLMELESVQNEMWNYDIAALSNILIKREVEEKIQVSDEEIARYYDANKEKYVIPERIQVRQIVVDDEATAERLAREARRGVSFRKLAKPYQEKMLRRGFRYDLGYQTRNSVHKEVVEKAFEAGPNQIIGPVKIGDVYRVIQTGLHQPQRQRPLMEVRNSIYSQLFNQKKQEMTAALEGQLKNEFSYRINESILRSVS